MALSRKKNISKSSLTSIVEGFRNFIGLTDDAWSTSEFFLSKVSKKIADKTSKISPYLAAISGGIFSLFEIYDAIKQLVKELKSGTLSTQKSLIVTNTLRILAAGVAAGLSVACVVGAAGIIGIAGIALFPFLIPGLLTLSSFLKLTYEGGKLHSIRKKQAQLKAELKQNQETTQALLKDIEKQQEHIQESKKHYSDKYDLNAIQAKKQKNSAEFIALFSYHELIKKEKSLSEQTELIQHNAAIQKSAYQKIKKERLNAERKVAFEALGAATATLATIGILLGTAAIIGAASVLALSTLGTGLLIAAGVAGLGLMIFSVVDKKKENRPTLFLRKTFKHLFQKMNPFSSKKPELENPEPEKNLAELPSKQALKESSYGLLLQQPNMAPNKILEHPANKTLIPIIPSLSKPISIPQPSMTHALETKIKPVTLAF